MKFIIFILKLAAAAYVAKYLSAYILSDQYVFISILFAGSICFLLSSLKHKFILLVLMIFFPVTFPAHFKLPIVILLEIISPIVCIMTVMEILKEEQSFFSRKASLFFASIGIFVLWLILHYINNPVLGQKVFGSVMGAGGIRNYYQAFVGITTFLCSYWFVMNNEINADRWLYIGLILALIVGWLVIIESFIGYIHISKLLTMGPKAKFWSSHYHSIPFRIIATLVSVLLLTVFHTRKWGFAFIIIFIQLIVSILLGGGRANMPAIFLSITAYVVLINRKYIFPVMSVLLIGVGIYIILFSNISFSEMKYGRVFATEGGLAEQSEGRYYSFLYRLEVFKSSPVFGKGIGFKELSIQEDFFVKYPEAIQYIEYIKGQAGIGGHGAYLSTISLFGIGGIFWLAVMLFGSIYYSYGIIKKRDEFQNDVKLALFVFLYFINFSIGFVVGGNGYTNYKLWFMAGIVAGLLSKDRGQVRIEI